MAPRFQASRTILEGRISLTIIDRVSASGLPLTNDSVCAGQSYTCLPLSRWLILGIPRCRFRV